MHRLRAGRVIGGGDVALAGAALVGAGDLEFTSDRVGTLPGVESAEVSPVHRQIKQAGSLVVDGRLQDP